MRRPTCPSVRDSNCFPRTQFFMERSATHLRDTCAIFRDLDVELRRACSMVCAQPSQNLTNLLYLRHSTNRATTPPHISRYLRDLS